MPKMNFAYGYYCKATCVRPSRRRPVIQKAARSSRSAIRISYAEIHSDIERRRSDAVYMSFLARLREKRLTFASLAR